MERDAISEITGRFNLGPNKVHTAHMYYGMKTRRLGSLSKKDQSLTSFSINRAQQLPYIPYEVAPIAIALAEARKSIFYLKRDSVQTLPRIAVLFNESPDTDFNS